MKRFLMILGSLLLLALAAFCVFGFLATFEPTDRPEMFVAFRVGYAVVGVGSLVGIVVLLSKSFRKSESA